MPAVKKILCNMKLQTLKASDVEIFTPPNVNIPHFSAFGFIFHARID